MEQVLIDSGLSPNQAKVYVGLSRIGHASVVKISEESGVYRSNVYDALKKLISLGLVSFYEENSVKYFETTNPEHLLALLHSKESQLKHILPQLALSKRLASHEGQAGVFKSNEAFLSLLNSLLEYKEPIHVFGAPPPMVIRGRAGEWHQKRIGKKIPIYVIYNKEDVDRLKFQKSLPYTETRLFTGTLDTALTTFICGSEVLLALWITPVLSIQLKNKVIADAYKDYYWLLWKSAKEV